MRVNEDLADKLSWIVRLKDVTVAMYLDPLVRGQIESDYTEIEPDVKLIQKNEDAAKKAEEAAKRKHADQK